MLQVAIDDARHCRRTRAELTRPGLGIACILAVLDIDPAWWRSIAVPGLQAKWAKADARRAAREQDMAIGLGGSGVASLTAAAVRSERSRRSWVTRRLRLAAHARGRPATGDWPGEGERRSTGSGAATAAI